MFLEIRALRLQLLLVLVGQRPSRPDLAVRSRIARPHLLASILEDLHVVDGRAGADGFILLGPGIHHRANGSRIHPRQREVVARREADYLANTRLSPCDKQIAFPELAFRRVWLQSGKVVLEDECRLILRVTNSTGSGVPRAEVAIRVVRNPRGSRTALLFTLPRPLRAVW